MHELPENWNTLFRRLLWAFLGIILGRLFTSSLFYCSLGEHLLFELVYAKKHRFLCVLKEAFCIEKFLVSKYSLDLCIFAKCILEEFVNDKCWIVPSNFNQNWPFLYLWIRASIFLLWKIYKSGKLNNHSQFSFFLFSVKYK